MSSTPTSNLVPGSIWERPVRDSEPSVSLVICVTNDGLSEHLLADNPQQVVFLSSTQKILSMPVEKFLSRKRTFVGMSENFAESFAALLNSATEEDEEDDEVDLDGVEVDPSLFTDAAGAATEAALREADSFVSSTNFALNIGPHPLKERIEEAFLGYSESPLFHTGDTLHTLQFLLDETLSLEDIRTTFSPTDPNSVQKFEVKTDIGSFQVDYEGFVSVMLQANGACAMGNLFLTSRGDFRAALTQPADEAPPAPAAPAVATIIQQQAGAPQAAPTTVVQQAQAPAPVTVH